MALTPYTVTALAQNDSQGTNGDNIVVGALVFAIAINGGATATLYDNAAGDNPSTTKQTGGNGQVTFYIEEGEYILSVNGVTSLVSLVSSDNVARLSDLKGKNLITDGRFDFWYEGTSQTSSGYGSDTMWQNESQVSSKTHTREDLLPTDLPAVDNPTAKYFSRTVVNSVAASNARVRKSQLIEGARTLSGKTVTVSFYARADGNKNIALSYDGQGATTYSQFLEQVSLTTQWQRFEVVFTIPTVSLPINFDYNSLSFWFDAGSDFDARTDSLGQQSGTFDIACVQLEDGSQATKFEEELPNVALERVDRYFERFTFNEYFDVNGGQVTSSTNATTNIRYAEKRGIPTVVVTLDKSGFFLTNSIGQGLSVSDVSASEIKTKTAILNITSSGLAPGDATRFLIANTNSSINIDARL